MYAFVLSYYSLMLLPLKDYEICISDTLRLAGDTDTNAAIVGGMIGAVIGRDKLPVDYVHKVLNCPAKLGQNGTMPQEV